MTNINLVLKAYRLRNELSQRDVARSLKLSFASYSKIESGSQIPKAPHVINILKLVDPSLGFTLSTLEIGAYLYLEKK